MSEPADDGGGPAELAEIRRVFSRAPSSLLRLPLVVGWVWLWVNRAARRDEGLQQRLELLRTLLRERRGKA